MSIVANFDINLRGNTSGVDKAADGTADKIGKLRQAVENHGSAISSRFAEMGGRMRAAFAALPGAGIITAVLGPGVYLAQTMGSAIAKLATGIAAATVKMSLLGVATTIASGGLNLIGATLAATGAAALGAGMAWTAFGLASSKGLDELGKRADKLGMGVEALAGLEHAAHLAGISAEELDTNLTKMMRNLGKEAGGGGANAAAVLGKHEHAGKAAEKAIHGVAAAWGKLKLRQDELKAGKPEDAFKQVAQAISEIPNPADRLKAATDVFGKSGAKMVLMMKDGVRGVEEAIAEAGALGMAATRRQIADVEMANEAVKRAMESLKGLGRTAAITLAPFQAMIANELTEAMKSLNANREAILNFSYSVEFGFKHAADYIALYMAKGILKVTEFANATIHIFTDVLPQLFKSFAQLLHEGLASGFAQGFDGAWQKAVLQIKASMARETGGMEDMFRRGAAQIDMELDRQKAKFIEAKKAALNIKSGTGTAGGGSGGNAAVERGSAEAFSIIHGDKGDKMLDALNRQIALQQKTLEEIKKKRARQPQIVEAGIF